MGIYLDYNASTPIDGRVLNKMIDIYRYHYGNADSRTHQFGSEANKIVETSRENVAALLGVSRGNVYFTSGSTESNNIAILGLESYGHDCGRRHIITTGIEHKSVLEPCKVLEKRGFEVEYVMPREDGRIQAEDVLKRVRKDTLLVSIMHVNNETGTIQPVEEIGETLAGSGVYFHVDASQSCGKLVEEIRTLSFDLLSVSAHKMYGPQGVGALVIKNKNGNSLDIKPIMYGGGQERGIRSGTLPVALIGGLGRAAEIISEEYKSIRACCCENLKRILNVLENSTVVYEINGDLQYNAGNTLNISFANYDSEALMLAMQETIGAGISNGSACTSHNYAPSYVLQAMGLDERRIANAVRISWGRELMDEFLFQEMVNVVKLW